MITLRVIVSGLYGAFRLACLKRDGADYFDKTLQGFWRSFFAAVLTLPFYVIFISLHFGEPVLTQDTFRYVSVELISYVIAWVAFPLVILPFARQFDREKIIWASLSLIIGHLCCKVRFTFRSPCLP